MPSAAGLQLNGSARTFPDLTALAQANPAEAQTFLERVSQNLQTTGSTQAVATLQALLAGTGSLVERINANAAQLHFIFPDAPTQWGQLQAQRAATVGWNATPPAVAKPTYLTGTVNMAVNPVTFTTTGGKVYNLAESSKAITQVPFPRSWMRGMVGDGPMVLKGTPGSDGTTFNVEGFALNTDGQYNTFTMGRVIVNGDNVVLNTPRGDLPVVNPDLKAKLRAMPRLGIILPGETEVQNGQEVYAGNPAEFFGLGRFVGTIAVQPADANTPAQWASADMAYSIFAHKPVTIPAGSEARVNHGQRMWVRGNVQLGPDGTASRFNASYLSQATDSGMSFAPTAPEADPVQAAVMTAYVP